MTHQTSGIASEDSPSRFGWLDASMWAIGAAAMASGMGQFAITAVIGDVAAEFGQPAAGQSLEAQLGLTGTVIGLALAVIRLTSLASLPATSLADRWGRRPVLLVSLTVGLGLTLGSVLAPGFWWWVAMVALARPWLSTTNAVNQVAAAEAVATRHRSWAMAFVAAAYAVGTGLVSIPRPVLPAGFRPVMLVAGLGLVAVPMVWRWVREPSIAAAVTAKPELPGRVPRAHVRNVVLMVVVAAGVALATGPAYTYVFLYGEQVLGLSRSSMAGVVVSAGPIGLVGLLTGRWVADNVGRRASVALGVVMAAAGFIATYQQQRSLLIGGYLVGLIGGAAMGPGLGAMAAEIFPTRIRATVAGWIAAAGVIGAVIGLASFGALADRVGFGGAAVVLAGISAVSGLTAFALPETRGLELDGVDFGSGA